MIHTSEWVSIGHPDKTADFISSFLLDRYIEADPDTRYAVEVQIKDQFVTLGGEVTSKAGFLPRDIEEFVRAAVARVGYTPEYRDYWGSANTIGSDDVVVALHLSQQSPDIAQGVDADRGWGDQGIFWGMAVNNPATDYMPPDWFKAQDIGRQLMCAPYRPFCGIDIKTQVTYDERIGQFRNIVIAAPVKTEEAEAELLRSLYAIIPGSAGFVLNGTGRYVRHGPLGDCGTTGRKLAVDFYGGNCFLGGGSPWTKDGTKADLTLNLYARFRALKKLYETGLPLVRCAISCRIGSPEIELAFFGENNNLIGASREERSPRALIDMFRLREPRYARMCMDGLFRWMPNPEAWDNCGIVSR